MVVFRFLLLSFFTFNLDYFTGISILHIAHDKSLSLSIHNNTLICMLVNTVSPLAGQLSVASLPRSSGGGGAMVLRCFSIETAEALTPTTPHLGQMPRPNWASCCSQLALIPNSMCRKRNHGLQIWLAEQNLALKNGFCSVTIFESQLLFR
jgi:hypothetical protein